MPWPKLLLQPQVNNQPLKQVGLALAHWEVRGDEINQLLAHVLREVHDDGHGKALARDEGNRPTTTAAWLAL